AKRDTDLAPFTSPSGGSRITYSQGKVVQQAAEEARGKAMTVAAEQLKVPEKSLVCSDGRIFVKDDPAKSLTLAEVGRIATNSRAGQAVGNAALTNLPYAPDFNCQAAVVHVDRETGQITLKRFLQAQDVGTAINPMVVTGQLEGGAVQGIGRALTEHYMIE